MTTEEKQVYLQRLEKNIRRTLEKIAQMEEMTQPVTPENAIGRISRMDAINNKSVMEAALRSARNDLEDMLAAQKRIDHPDFGKCEKCKGEIPYKRLLIMPGATKCTRCAGMG